MEKLDDLIALAKSYTDLSPDQMQRFMATASVIPEATGLVRVAGRNVLRSGDSLTLRIDVISRKQRRVEIHSAMNGNPVRIVSEFQDIPDGGPTYMARSEVNYNNASLIIITENFEYTRVAKSSGIGQATCTSLAHC